MISPGLRIGRYEVGKRLGKGGFGVVHLARDVDLDRDIAIKVLKPEYLAKPQIVQRFIKEARAAAKIGHPGIVTVFECGQIQGTGTRADGNAYIAMELLVGESLADRLLNDGRMSAPAAIWITRQLAAALGAAHTAGIIHRDLKPDNVFLVPDAAVHGGDRAKVLDFGVAKLIELGEDGINTHSQMMLGTPKYMSPEQARSAAKADHRADIYTLGCMLFEMLTGRTPFSGDSGEQLLAHQKTPPPSARQLVSTVPLAIDALICRMLAKTPDERPQSMTEVVDALADLDEADTTVRAPIEPPPTPVDLHVSEITTVAGPVRASIDTEQRRRRILLAAAGASAVVSSLVAFFLLRSDPSPRTPPPSDAAIAIDAVVAVADAAIEPDAALADDADRLRLQCAEAADAKRWRDLVLCAEALREIDASAGDRFYATAHAEQRAEVSYRNLSAAVAETNLTKAKDALDQISEDSVYHLDAAARFQKLEQALRESPKSAPPEAPTDPCARHEELVESGRNLYAQNRHSEALAVYEQALKCKRANVLKQVVAAACRSKNRVKARQYWNRLNPADKVAMEALCAQSGFFKKDLEE